MPRQTLAPGTSTYHSGTFRHKWMFPDCYHDPKWISQWKFDDITSGSGLDSKHTNNLIASGSPVNTTGYRQTSGVLFDGINDCFYLPWANGSGLQGCRVSLIEDGVSTVTPYPNFGFMCSLRCDDFSSDKILFSKWNEVSSDREWMFGINTSGGLFYGWKQNGTTNIWFTNSARSGIIQSGQWHDFAIFWQGIENTSSTDGVSVFMLVDNVMMVNCHGVPPERVGSSGVFHIGAANFGKAPSGFFKGAMEDVRFYNGRHPSLPNYLAFRSGISPLTTYPSINDGNQYVAAHITFNTLTSGALDYGTVGSGWRVHERKNNYIIHGSGTNFSTTQFRHEPGAADGTKGSGLSLSSTANSVFARLSSNIREDSIAQRHSLTISYWVRHNAANTEDPIIFGYQTHNGSISNGPWNVQHRDRARPSVSASKDVAVTAHTVARNLISSGCWVNCIHVINLEESRVDTWVSGVWIYGTSYPTTSGLWLTDPQPGSDFRIGQLSDNVAQVGFSGILDEIIILGYAVPSGFIGSFYSQQSGFLTQADPQSGMLGGYTYAIDAERSSGILGGYVIVGPTTSGNIGGWISGLPIYTSGMLGGYVVVGPTASGNIGGYSVGVIPVQNTIGAYAAMAGASSGSIGAYTRGIEPVDESSAFLAFYNIIGRDKKEFDALAKISNTSTKEFDAKAVVYIDELPPVVNIFIPSTHQSGTTVPITYHFEATASGQQGKTIHSTLWFFTDISSASGSTVTSSGTYATDHTFAQSGLFNVIFVAIDSNGIISSDRRMINTVSGYSIPQIQLNASPESGIAPLQVGFSGIIQSSPTPILDKYIYFGDGTRSASTNSIYKNYIVPGNYIPIFRVRDASGIIVTDSTIIGVNN